MSLNKQYFTWQLSSWIKHITFFFYKNKMRTIRNESLDDPKCQFQLRPVSCYITISKRKNSWKYLFLLWTKPFRYFSFFPLMKLTTYFYSIPSFLEKYFHQHAGHRTDFDRPQEIESTLSLSSIPTTI